MTDEISWKGLALGLGAHLEAVEAHCSVATEKTGEAHAAEGQMLRKQGQKMIEMVKHAVSVDPV